MNPIGNNSILESIAQRGDIKEIINRGLAYAILIAGFLSVVFIFVGGISFILSGGDEGKIKQAVGTIRYAIIGLIITVLAVVVVTIVGKSLFGINIIEYINFSDIIKTVTSIGHDSSIPRGLE